ncbi:MAG: hypothetical protein IPK98_00970 [Chloracidobacterium sp.]|nr:hypothetical protein [Chloracidobacterium sp.]
MSARRMVTQPSATVKLYFRPPLPNARCFPRVWWGREDFLRSGVDVCLDIEIGVTGNCKEKAAVTGLAD